MLAFRMPGPSRSSPRLGGRRLLHKPIYANVGDRPLPAGGRASTYRSPSRADPASRRGNSQPPGQPRGSGQRTRKPASSAMWASAARTSMTSSPAGLWLRPPGPPQRQCCADRLSMRFAAGSPAAAHGESHVAPSATTYTSSGKIRVQPGHRPLDESLSRAAETAWAFRPAQRQSACRSGKYDAYTSA